MINIGNLNSIWDSPQIGWKPVITALVIGKYAFETYIDLRQYRALKGTELSASLKNEILQDVFEQSQEYSRAEIELSFFKNAFSVAKELVMISFDLFPKLWSFAGHSSILLAKVPFIGGLFGASVLSQSMTMFAITRCIDAFETLPVSYYSNFVLEEKFGFNKSTTKTWLLDSLKVLLVNVGLGSPIVYGFVRIMDHFGSSFMVYMCLFSTLAQIAAFAIIPNLVYPLFYKFNRLEDGELLEKIDAMAKKNGFPVGNVWVIDSSSRSSHSNAFFLGLPWCKQIVLFDTLIQQNTPDQIVAVLAHEIGHWKMNHSLELMLENEIFGSLNLLLFSVFYDNKSFLHSFGFYDGCPVFISYYLFTYVEASVSCATHFLRNLRSRSKEYSADAFALAQGYGNELSKALITLETENLSCPISDPLYSSYHHHHPTLTDRLNALGYVSKEKVGNLKVGMEKK